MIKRKGLERAHLHLPADCEQNERKQLQTLSPDSVFPPDGDTVLKVCEKEESQNGLAWKDDPNPEVI